MPNHIPDRGTLPPDEFDRDLHPHLTEGLNRPAGEHSEWNAPSARDIKAVHRRLHDLPDSDLKNIPIVPAGRRLEQGATYVDLKRPDCREFTATGDMVAEPGHWYVPKHAVDYQLWNVLIGVDNPERIGMADERTA